MKVLTKELDTYEKTNANNPHSKHTVFRAQITVANNLNLFSPRKFSLNPIGGSHHDFYTLVCNSCVGIFSLHHARSSRRACLSGRLFKPISFERTGAKPRSVSVDRLAVPVGF